MCEVRIAAPAWRSAASTGMPVRTGQSTVMAVTSRPSTWKLLRAERRKLLVHFANETIEVDATGARTAISEHWTLKFLQRGGLIGDIVAGDLAAHHGDVAELHAGCLCGRLDACGGRLAGLFV